MLVRPKSAGNIGSVARALKNTGFSELRLVAPQVRKGNSAVMAVHAKDLLAAATTHPTLAAALDGCTSTVGTTCRTGPYRAAAKLVREAAGEISALAESNRVAIIFGPEDTGLTNEELKLCHRLITIPTAPGYRSLNLAQAVMVVAYELMLAAEAPRAQPECVEFAPAVEVDAMLQRMREALLATGFLPEDNPDHIMFTLRAIFGRSGLEPRELEIMNGIARQMRWAAEGGHRELEEKRRTGKKLK